MRAAGRSGAEGGERTGGVRAAARSLRSVRGAAHSEAPFPSRKVTRKDQIQLLKSVEQVPPHEIDKAMKPDPIWRPRLPLEGARYQAEARCQPPTVAARIIASSRILSFGGRARADGHDAAADELTSLDATVGGGATRPSVPLESQFSW